MAPAPPANRFAVFGNSSTGKQFAFPAIIHAESRIFKGNGRIGALNAIRRQQFQNFIHPFFIHSIEISGGIFHRYFRSIIIVVIRDGKSSSGIILSVASRSRRTTPDNFSAIGLVLCDFPGRTSRSAK